MIHYFLVYNYKTKKLEIAETENKADLFAVLDEEKILVVGEISPYQSPKTIRYVKAVL